MCWCPGTVRAYRVRGSTFVSPLEDIPSCSRMKLLRQLLRWLVSCEVDGNRAWRPALSEPLDQLAGVVQEDFRSDSLGDSSARLVDLQADFSELSSELV